MQFQNISYQSNDAAHQNLLIPDTSSVTIDAGANWNMVHGVETIDGLNGGGSFTVYRGGGVSYLAGAPALTVGAGNGNGTFSGAIQDTATGVVTLDKTGTGTQILGSLTSITTAASTFSGNVTVDGGSLIVAALSSAACALYGLGQCFERAKPSRSTRAERFSSTLPMFLAASVRPTLPRWPSTAALSPTPIRQTAGAINNALRQHQPYQRNAHRHHRPARRIRRLERQRHDYIVRQLSDLDERPTLWHSNARKQWHDDD